MVLKGIGEILKYCYPHLSERSIFSMSWRINFKNIFGMVTITIPIDKGRKKTPSYTSIIALITPFAGSSQLSNSSGTLSNCTRWVM